MRPPRMTRSYCTALKAEKVSMNQRPKNADERSMGRSERRGVPSSSAGGPQQCGDRGRPKKSLRKGCFVVYWRAVPEPRSNLQLWWVIPKLLAGMPMPHVHLDRRLNKGGPLVAHPDDLPILHAEGIRAVVCLLNIPTD